MGDGAAGAATPGELPLAGWRRLDWRFLLPDLPSGAVRYSARVGPEFAAALQLLGLADLEAVEDGDWERLGAGSARLVLLRDPTGEEVSLAARVLEPGGHLYTEVVRGWSSSAGARTLPHTRRQLRAAGLTEVRSYWHAPDFEICARIIPLDSSSAVRNTLLRFSGVRFGYLKSVVGRCALRVGLFPFAVTHGSVVATRPRL